MKSLQQVIAEAMHRELDKYNPFGSPEDHDEVAGKIVDAIRDHIENDAWLESPDMLLAGISLTLDGDHRP